MEKTLWMQFQCKEKAVQKSCWFTSTNEDGNEAYYFGIVLREIPVFENRPLWVIVYDSTTKLVLRIVNETKGEFSESVDLGSFSIKTGKPLVEIILSTIALLEADDLPSDNKKYMLF